MRVHVCGDTVMFVTEYMYVHMYVQIVVYFFVLHVLHVT